MVSEITRKFKPDEKEAMEHFKKRQERMGYLVWTEEKNGYVVVHAELERGPYQYKPSNPQFEEERRKRMFKRLTGKNPRE